VTAPDDLQDRTEGELLEGLACAADRRRSEATASDDDSEREHRIDDLEDALVGELRSRRASE
jgi:hypothetical protein